LPQEYEKESMYKKYYLVKEAENHDFKKTFELLKFIYPDKEMERLFKGALRIKKGIEQTSIKHTGTIFMKDKIYLEGYENMKRRTKD